MRGRSDPGPGVLVGLPFHAFGWRTRHAKKGIYIVIEWIPKSGRYFWKLENAEGGLIQASWPDAPHGYANFTTCHAEAREARIHQIAWDAEQAAKKAQGVPA